MKMMVESVLLIFPQTMPGIWHNQRLGDDKFIDRALFFFLQTITYIVIFYHLPIIFQFSLNLQSSLKLLIYSMVSYVGTYGCDTA